MQTSPKFSSVRRIHFRSPKIGARFRRSARRSGGRLRLRGDARGRTSPAWAVAAGACAEGAGGALSAGGMISAGPGGGKSDCRSLQTRRGGHGRGRYGRGGERDGCVSGAPEQGQQPWRPKASITAPLMLRATTDLLATGRLVLVLRTSERRQRPAGHSRLRRRDRQGAAHPRGGELSPRCAKDPRQPVLWRRGRGGGAKSASARTSSPTF